MTKRAFMSSLTRELFFEIPFGELKKVKSDYEKLFADGKANGLSEEDVIREIGTPSLACAEVLSEHTQVVKVSHKSLRAILALALVIIYGLVERYHKGHGLFAEYNQDDMVLFFTMVIPSILFVILGGTALIPINAKKTKPNWIFIGIHAGITAVLWALPSLLTRHVYSVWTSETEITCWLVHSFSAPLNTIFIILFWANLFMLAFVTLCTIRRGAKYLPLIYIYSTTFFCMLLYNSLLSNMENPASLLPLIYENDGKILFALALLAILLPVALYLYRLMKNPQLQRSGAYSKRQFISDLSKELLLNVSFAELKRIKVDFEKQFAEKEMDGKTEGEIIRELGSPQLVAEEILSEGHHVKECRSDHKLLRISIIAAGLLLLTIFEIFAAANPAIHYIRLTSPIAYIVLIPTAIVMILGGKKLTSQNIRLKGMGKFYLIGTFIPLLLCTAATFIIYTLCDELRTDSSEFWFSSPEAYLPMTAVGFMNIIICLLCLLAYLAILMSCVVTVRFGIKLAPIIYLQTIALYRVYTLITMLCDMSSPDILWSNATEQTGTALLGIIAIIAASILAFIGHKVYVKLTGRDEQ